MTDDKPITVMRMPLAAKLLFCGALHLLAGSGLLAQDSAGTTSTLTVSGFVDVYYSYDFTKPLTQQKAPFLYNHNRHNEVTVNLAQVTLSYKDSAKRANVGLMAGTYPQYNLAGEPPLLQHIYEANVGVRLTRKKALWLDAGIMPSHIGFESAVSKDCWTLTRSLLAENSPYYEAGVRASYRSSSQKWYLAFLFLNGWQRIKRVEGNNSPSFGTQLTYTPTAAFTVNSSTFMGNDKPDSVKRWRYFHNLYAIWQLSAHWGLTLGFDAGMEQRQKRSSAFQLWYSPVLLVRYQHRNWAVAARAEYYQDKNGVLITLVNGRPFRMQGYSINIDRTLAGSLLVRLEGRWLSNASAYFTTPSGRSSTSVQLTSSLSYVF